MVEKRISDEIEKEIIMAAATDSKRQIAKKKHVNRKTVDRILKPITGGQIQFRRLRQAYKCENPDCSIWTTYAPCPACIARQARQVTIAVTFLRREEIRKVAHCNVPSDR